MASSSGSSGVVRLPVLGAGGHYSSQWRYFSGASIFMPEAVLLHCLRIQNFCGWQRFIVSWPAYSKLKTIGSSGFSFTVTRTQGFLSLRLLPPFGASTLSSGGNSSERTNKYLSVFQSR